MPRSRKTYAQAELEGSLAVHKGRFAGRASAPPTTGAIGAAPDYFNPDQEIVWYQIVRAIPPGVAGSADCFAVETAARLLYEFRTNNDMPASKIAIMGNTLSRLGLDPQARTRLLAGVQPPATEETAIDRFFASVERNKKKPN